MQKTLITKESKTLTVEQAKKFLEDRGYHVEKFDNSIPQLQVEIVKDFYKGLSNLIGEKRLTFLNVQDKEDARAIDRYLKKSSRLGITKLDSLKYLKEVVKLLFKEYNSLGLTQPPTSMTFLLSHNGNWIIDKLMVIMESRVKNYDSSPEAMAFKESIYEMEDDKFLQLQQDRHKKLLKD